MSLPQKKDVSIYSEVLTITSIKIQKPWGQRNYRGKRLDYHILQSRNSTVLDCVFSASASKTFKIMLLHFLLKKWTLLSRALSFCGAINSSFVDAVYTQLCNSVQKCVIWRKPLSQREGTREIVCYCSSKERFSSWEANSLSVNQENFRCLWNLQVYYMFHKTRQLDSEIEPNEFSPHSHVVSVNFS